MDGHTRSQHKRCPYPWELLAIRTEYSSTNKLITSKSHRISCVTWFNIAVCVLYLNMIHHRYPCLQTHFNKTDQTAILISRNFTLVSGGSPEFTYVHSHLHRGI